MRKGNGVREMKCRVRSRNGTVRDALVFGEELNLNQERCLLVLFHDMTEQLKLEAQLRQSQKMEAVGQLASGVAHDFNNLLTIIRGHAEIRIGAVNTDPELAASLKQIARATERAAGLTRQLLAFSRRHMTQPKPVDLNELIQNLRDMAQSLISEQIQFHCELADGLPPVHADPFNLEQVLVNLIMNARDAMPHGGELTIRTAVLNIGESETAADPDSRPGPFVRLQIEDTGCGMDTQILSRIFEPFFTTKPIGKGTGMGLAMVYGIVKQHEGWIRATSQPGKGTVFTVILPVSTESAAPVAEMTTPQARRGHETILVVEDEPTLRAVTAEMLDSAGYRVLQASSGVDGLKVWFAEREKIDLVFSDIVMPGGMNGRKLVEKLQARKPGLKVILTSGHQEELKGAVSELPGVTFVAKPYSPAGVVATVRACLDKEEAAAA